MDPLKQIALLRNILQADRTCLEGTLELERKRNATYRQLLDQAMGPVVNTTPAAQSDGAEPAQQ